MAQPDRPTATPTFAERATVAAALRASGFIVIEAARAGEACVFVESGGLVDLVFSDVERCSQVVVEDGFCETRPAPVAS